jgi:spermidine synthase
LADIPLFAELDYRITPIGAVSLRRRRDLAGGAPIYEIKLGEEFLMASNFTVSEIALADLSLAALGEGPLDVVVGGLGLGYTAKAVLGDARVGSLVVAEFLEPVIDWHRNGLLPLGADLFGDDRFSVAQGDFFAMAAGEGFDPRTPGRTFDAIIVDIDHSPEALLDERSTGFYRPEGLVELKRHLKPGGIFSLWSNDPPDETFRARLETVFGTARAEPVIFFNPLLGTDCTQAVYIGVNSL